MTVESERKLNMAAVSIVLAITALIIAGQSTDAILSSMPLRSAFTVIMFVFVVFSPVSSLAIVVMGYFFPIIISAKLTLLPANFYYYLAMMLFALVCNLFSGREEAQEAGAKSKLIILFYYFLYIFVISISELSASAFGGGSSITLNSTISLMLGLFAVLLVKTRRDEDMVLMTFVATSLALSIWTVFMAGKVNVVGDRFEVGFDQNYLSLFIGLGVVVLTSFLLVHRASLSKSLKLCFIAIFLVDWMAILRLGSRGVVIALALTTAWLILRNSRNLLQTLISITIAGMFLLIITQLPGMEMMSGRFKDKDIATASRRMPLWTKSIDHVRDSPVMEMFIGGGSGSGKKALQRAFRTGVPISPHNQYLETVMDYGLLGLVALLGLIFVGFRRSLKILGYVGNIRASMLLFMLIGFVSLTPLMYVLTWVALGFALSAPAASESYV